MLREKQEINVSLMCFWIIQEQQKAMRLMSEKKNSTDKKRDKNTKPEVIFEY